MATVKIPFPIQVVQKVGRKRNDILSSVTNFALPETEKRFRNIFFFIFFFKRNSLSRLLPLTLLEGWNSVPLFPIFFPLSLQSAFVYCIIASAESCRTPFRDMTDTSKSDRISRPILRAPLGKFPSSFRGPLQGLFASHRPFISAIVLPRSLRRSEAANAFIAKERERERSKVEERETKPRRVEEETGGECQERLVKVSLHMAPPPGNVYSCF